MATRRLTLGGLLLLASLSLAACGGAAAAPNDADGTEPTAAEPANGAAPAGEHLDGNAGDILFADTFESADDSAWVFGDETGPFTHSGLQKLNLTLKADKFAMAVTPVSFVESKTRIELFHTGGVDGWAGIACSVRPEEPFFAALITPMGEVALVEMVIGRDGYPLEEPEFHAHRLIATGSVRNVMELVCSGNQIELNMKGETILALGGGAPVEPGAVAILGRSAAALEVWMDELEITRP